MSQPDKSPSVCVLLITRKELLNFIGLHEGILHELDLNKAVEGTLFQEKVIQEEKFKNKTFWAIPISSLKYLISSSLMDR